MQYFLKQATRLAGKCRQLKYLPALLIGSTALLAPGVTLDGYAAETSPRHNERRQFNAVYEPSGAAQLPDGRVVIVEDRRRKPISLLEIGDDLKMSAEPLKIESLAGMLTRGFVRGSLEDLEAIDIDRRGFVYAITSYSRNASGTRSVAREKLIRFRFDGTRIAEWKILTGLGKAMAKIDKKLKAATKILDVKDDNGFNIEGLSFNKKGDKLFFGLRSPVINGKGVIIVMENPIAAFENGESPKFADDPIFVDLDKGGIRAIAFDPKLDGYLMISRREKKGRKFKLWLWDGRAGNAPRRVRIKGDVDLSKAEGITPIRNKGTERILIVFDTGKRSKGRNGQYLLLAYDQLEIDPTTDRSTRLRRLNKP